MAEHTRYMASLLGVEAVQVVDHGRQRAVFLVDTPLGADDHQVQRPCFAYLDRLHALGQRLGLVTIPG